MVKSVMSRIGMALLALAATITASDGAANGQETEEKRLTVLWIYRDAPRKGEEDTRTGSERVFQPYYIYPEDMAENVVINDRLKASEVDEEAKGTVCEFSFRLKAEDFAGVKFIPGGRNPGTKPGLDVTRALFLDRHTPVALRLRVRTVTDARVKVWFKIGGAAGPRYRDGLRFPEVARPSPTVVTGQWTDVTIPLKGKANELKSVICPLEVMAKAVDNPGVSTLIVYVDDVRFEISR